MPASEAHPSSPPWALQVNFLILMKYACRHLPSEPFTIKFVSPSSPLIGLHVNASILIGTPALRSISRMILALMRRSTRSHCHLAIMMVMAARPAQLVNR